MKIKCILHSKFEKFADNSKISQIDLVRKICETLVSKSNIDFSQNEMYLAFEI